jgi:hypothetical protein
MSVLLSLPYYKAIVTKSTIRLTRWRFGMFENVLRNTKGDYLITSEQVVLVEFTPAGK